MIAARHGRPRHGVALVAARPRPDVFAFLADPATPARDAAGAPRSSLTSGVKLGRGAVLDFRLPGWAALRWRLFVREWDPPYRFVDVQVNGRMPGGAPPSAAGRGRWNLDRGPRDLRLPARPAGPGPHALLVGRQLRAAWTYRRERLIALLAPISRRQADASCSSRGRTRSLSRPMRARFCTIEECRSLRNTFGTARSRWRRPSRGGSGESHHLRRAKPHVLIRLGREEAVSVFSSAKHV